jgi:uncharacterized protein DUF2652/polyketide cyclase/dehydrase/lipid transport protein
VNRFAPRTRTQQRSRPPRARGQRGTLLLADISGYTRYLRGVELEHAQDVLADLFSVLVEQLHGLLEIAELEGDAVFAYESGPRADGSSLLAAIEACYFAFAQRRRTISTRSTCPCDACRRIVQLDLKFVVHHGEYVIQEVGTSRKPMGSDVVLAHRALKNTVQHCLGIRAYALFTKAWLDAVSIRPQALGLVAHPDRYSDVGGVSAYVHDLAARWAEEERRRSVYVKAKESVATAEQTVAAAPAAAWEYLTSPRKQELWLDDTQSIEEQSPRGVRGVGTTTHCVHSKFAYDQEILDWKPLRYFTQRTVVPVLGPFTMTVELVPVADDQTRIAWRVRPDGRWRQRLVIRLLGARQRAFLERSADNLARVVEQSQLPLRG